MHRRAIAYIIGLLLILPFAYADITDRFIVNVDPLAESAMQSMNTPFRLEIINLGTSDDIAFLRTADLKWGIQTEPLTDYTSGIYISSGAGRTTTVLLRPSLEVKPGSSFVELLIKFAESGTTVSKIIPVNVKKYVETRNDVTITIEAPSKVDPRKTLSVKVILTNNNAKEFQDLKIELNSNLISKKGSVDLAGFGTATAEFTIQLDSKVEPRIEKVVASAVMGNETVNTAVKDIEIVSFREPFSSSEEKKVGFFSCRKVITVKNDANIYREDEFLYKTNWFVEMFSKTEPESRTKHVGWKRYNVWMLGLRANESTTLVISRNFISLPILAVIIAGALFIYYTYRSPVVAKKSVRRVRQKEGGISELKVILHLKNRTKRLVNEVNIIDRVPHIASILKKEEHGTIRPDKVMSYQAGTVAKWILAQLEPHEERLITYNISSKVSILGELRLKPAMIQFGDKGSRRKVASNSVNIAVKKELKEE